MNRIKGLKINTELFIVLGLGVFNVQSSLNLDSPRTVSCLVDAPEFQGRLSG